MDLLNRSISLARRIRLSRRLNSDRRLSLNRRIYVLLVLVLPAGWSGPAQGGDEIVAITTDYSTGSITTLPAEPPWNPELDREAVCSDAVGRPRSGKVYVVNRLGCDNLQVLDPAQGYDTVAEFSVGSGSNPQDIAFIEPDRAYVTCYDRPWLLEVNPLTGAILDSVSLAPLADGDGLPEMHRMFRRGDYLYVQVQRLDRDTPFWDPVPPSYLAVVNLNTRELVDVDSGTPGIQGIVLQGTDPNAPMQIDQTTGDLLVPEAGTILDVEDGGIERVDLDRWTSRGFLITGAELGGDLVDFCLWSGTRGYAIVSDESFVTCLVSFDPSTGLKTGTLYCSSGFDLSDCLTHEAGYLFVGDRDFFDPGVRVYDAETGALLSDGVIPTGLPPFELLLHREDTSGVPGEPAPAGDGTSISLFAREPYPNPTQGAVTFVVRGYGAARPADPSSPNGAGFRAEIFDARGRLVRRLAVPAERSLTGDRTFTRDGSFTWDGTDRAGRDVGAGSYWIRVADSDGRSEARAVRVVR